jgi:hypothetical protein
LPLDVERVVPQSSAGRRGRGVVIFLFGGESWRVNRLSQRVGGTEDARAASRVSAGRERTSEPLEGPHDGRLVRDGREKVECLVVALDREPSVTALQRDGRKVAQGVERLTGIAEIALQRERVAEEAFGAVVRLLP